MQLGYEIAVSDVNTSGGVLGRCVSLIVRDDAGDPAKATQIARQFLDEDKIDLAVGPSLSAAAQVSAPLMAAAGVLQAFSATADALSDAQKFPTSFRTTYPADSAAEQYLAYLDSKGIEKVGIIAVNSTVGTSQVDAIKSHLADYKVKVSGTEFFAPGQLDVETQVQNLKDSDAGALIVVAAGADFVPPLKARADLAWSVPVLAPTVVANKAIIDAVGDSGMKGVLVLGLSKQIVSAPGETDPRGATMTKFRDELKAKMGVTTLDSYFESASVGYDALRILTDTINKVGAIDAKKVQTELETNGYDGLEGHDTYTSTKHTGLAVDQLTAAVATSQHDGILQEAT